MLEAVLLVLLLLLLGHGARRVEPLLWMLRLILRAWFMLALVLLLVCHCACARGSEATAAWATTKGPLLVLLWMLRLLLGEDKNRSFALHGYAV